MNIKNITWVRLTEDNPYKGGVDKQGLKDLNLKLRFNCFQLCPAFQLQSVGFVPPCDAVPDLFYQSVDGAIVVCLQVEKRLVSSAAIKQELAAAVAVIEESENRIVGKAEKRRIKQRLEGEALARSQTVKKRIYAWIDTVRGLLVVCTSKQNEAEEMASWIRRALQSFPTMSLMPNLRPEDVMGQWITGDFGELENGFPLGLEDADLLVLENDDEYTPTITLKNVNIEHPSVVGYIRQDGFWVSKMRLCYCLDDFGAYFTLNMRMQVANLTCNKLARELDEGEDALTAWRGDTILAVDVAGSLFDLIGGWFGGLV